ncbi:MAG: YjbF family lipoprotein [Magnetococcales bacterium]|nr:YjbF family lipoprotein [Magnetococcales bacterium]NGZ27274.1 YjbF family lipoprotein [Magnetococcales bacterium]
MDKYSIRKDNSITDLSRIPLSRRTFCLMTLASMVTGCSSDSQFQHAAKAVQIDVSSFPDVPITRQQVDNLPYASIGAKLGKGPRSMLVLGKAHHQEAHWYSANRVAIVTRHGRIIKTAGLEKNLTNTMFYNKDPLATPTGQKAAKHSWIRAVDMAEDQRYQIALPTTWREEGHETIEILGQTYNTLKITENVVARNMDWKYSNTFWLDAQSGIPWRSIQHFHPELPPFVIEIFKVPDLAG